jgi:succinate dehydrogenase/fumarate reductase flavoprotein subunit
MQIGLSDLKDGDVFDVVVVGAGAAGMTAALTAAIEGQKTLLVERTDRVGGTTAFSAGSAWIPNTHHGKAVGAEDSLEKAATYLRNSVGNQSSEGMRRVFLEAGPQAVAELESKSEIRFRARALHPDYNTELDGSTLRGRVLEAMPFDGRKLGPLLALIREPIPEFTILGGLMVNQEDVLHLLAMRRSLKSFVYGTKLLGNHLLDRLRHPRSTRLMMGNALAGRLLYSLDQRQVPILVEASVEEIARDAGGVSGVTLRQNGTVRRIAVRRGLIMATGGFGRHPARRAEFLPPAANAYCPGAPGHTGQLHDLVLAAGGAYGEPKPDNGFWAPVSVRTRADGSTAVFPHFLLDRGRPGFVTVNAAGRRFVNEAVSYHPFVQGMLRAGAAPGFLITDAAGLRKYGIGMVRPGGFGLGPYLADGYLTRGATLAELAGKLGIDAKTLERTVAQMNDYAHLGRDPEFGRGSTDYQRITAGDRTHPGPNPCLGPIARAPFYAIRLYPGDIGVALGFKTDRHARVLTRDGAPLGRLYACGNDMDSVMGGNYPGPGITIGPAIVFGYIAAKHAAGK